MLGISWLLLIELTHRAQTNSNFHVGDRYMRTLLRTCGGKPKTTLRTVAATRRKLTGKYIHIFICWMRMNSDPRALFHLESMKGTLGCRFGKNRPAAAREHRQILKRLLVCILKLLSHYVYPQSVERHAALQNRPLISYTYGELLFLSRSMPMLTGYPQNIRNFPLVRSYYQWLWTGDLQAVDCFIPSA